MLVIIILGDVRVDMRAVYLQSVRSPYHHRRLMSDMERYRLQRQQSHWHSVYSQPVDSIREDDDEDYVEDSFCVNGSVSDPQGELLL